MARILLIDDDDALRTVVARSLSLAGHEVVQAADGQDGISHARASTFDVVITDLIMPVQEGVETISILRHEQPLLPVIAISGGVTNSPLYLTIARKIGARCVLAKPFTSVELQAAIAEVLSPPPSTPPTG